MEKLDNEVNLILPYGLIREKVGSITTRWEITYDISPDESEFDTLRAMVNSEIQSASLGDEHRVTILMALALLTGEQDLNDFIESESHWSQAALRCILEMYVAEGSAEEVSKLQEASKKVIWYPKTAREWRISDKPSTLKAISQLFWSSM